MLSESGDTTIRTFPSHKQRRLDALMDRHTEGQLSGSELEELRGLVAEAEALALANAERLVEARARERGQRP